MMNVRNFFLKSVFNISQWVADGPTGALIRTPVGAFSTNRRDPEVPMNRDLQLAPFRLSFPQSFNGNLNMDSGYSPVRWQTHPSFDVTGEFRNDTSGDTSLLVAGLFIVLTILSLSTTVLAGGGANSGLSFLKIGVDARAAALGDAYTSIADDASSTFWNPAGLAGSKSNSIILMHNAWLQGINHEFAAIQFVHGQHNLAVSLNMINVSGIELRDETASVEPIGETQSLNTYIGISYATKIFSDWQVGLQLKYLYEKYYLDSAGGFALDFGLRKPDIIYDISWGFVVQNLGKMSVLKNESTSLPIIIRTGLSYLLPWQLLDQRPLVTSDLTHVLNDVTTVGLGLEMELISYTQLRIGYLFGRDSQSMSAGFGLYYGIFNFSYAFVPYSYDLGNSHRFSLLVEF